jgi:hypothetical protein
MKPTKSRGTRSSPKQATKHEAKAVKEDSAELKSRTARNSARDGDGKSSPELDRRGKPLPPRQRVGGIITPQ